MHETLSCGAFLRSEQHTCGKLGAAKEEDMTFKRTRRHRGRKGKWKLAPSALVPALIGVLGLGIFLYPQAASWVSQLNQSKIVDNYERQVNLAHPSAAEQIKQAHAYNAALSAGAVYKADTNIPTGAGKSSNGKLDYNAILRTDESGLMARLRIPAIDVDLPVYHGTSDATLLQGAGHLEGTSLPVGGPGTRSVITAHRGLANATMFTNLDRVKIGDTFTIEVFGKVLAYKVRETKVVEPTETESLRSVPGKDLVTLVTCTPLGINTHRILVTAERIEPTPAKDLANAHATSDLPRFPWWAVWFSAGLLVAAVYVWRSGRTDKTRPAQAPEA